MEVGRSLINMAVWNKGAGGMGGLYRSTHEMIAVFCTSMEPAMIQQLRMALLPISHDGEVVGGHIVLEAARTLESIVKKQCSIKVNIS